MLKWWYTFSQTITTRWNVFKMLKHVQVGHKFEKSVYHYIANLASSFSFAVQSKWCLCNQNSITIEVWTMIKQNVCITGCVCYISISFYIFSQNKSSPAVDFVVSLNLSAHSYRNKQCPPTTLKTQHTIIQTGCKA